MASNRRTLARKIAIRFLAVVVGLSPLVLIEVALRVAGVGRPQLNSDPLVGFESIQPLFVLNQDRWEIPKGRQEFFRPESFAAEKPQKQFRIFCLGGSTVQGRPYQIETSFTTWLQINLNVADPTRTWRVINCGGVSYASYRLVPVLDEILDHQADLIILYTGHNEFLESRTYSSIKQMHPLAKRMVRGAFQLRTVQWLWRQRNEWVRGSPSSAELLPTEVDALLDYRGGLEHYNFDAGLRGSVIEHFGLNIRRIVRRCQQRQVPILLIDPIYNLQDSPPFKIGNDPELKPDRLRQFHESWRRAKRADCPLAEKVRLLRECIQIDGEHAGVHFHLAKCLQALKRFDEARLAYMRAKDTDICPLRILEAQRRILRQTSKEFQVPIVDLNGEFAARSEQGLLGKQWLVDHVHPSILGHQLIADLLTQQLQQMKIVALSPNWQEKSKPLQARHLRSLDELYHQHAKIRLDGLRKWSQGRGTKIREQATAN